eukprot:32691_1
MAEFIDPLEVAYNKKLHSYQDKKDIWDAQQAQCKEFDFHRRIQFIQTTLNVHNGQFMMVELLNKKSNALPSSNPSGTSVTNAGYKTWISADHKAIMAWVPKKSDKHTEDFIQELIKANRVKLSDAGNILITSWNSPCNRCADHPDQRGRYPVVEFLSSCDKNNCYLQYQNNYVYNNELQTHFYSMTSNGFKVADCGTKKPTKPIKKKPKPPLKVDEIPQMSLSGAGMYRSQKKKSKTETPVKSGPNKKERKKKEARKQDEARKAENRRKAEERRYVRLREEPNEQNQTWPEYLSSWLPWNWKGGKSATEEYENIYSDQGELQFGYGAHRYSF